MFFFVRQIMNLFLKLNNQTCCGLCVKHLCIYEVEKKPQLDCELEPENCGVTEPHGR
jgi:hypothetical protein